MGSSSLATLPLGFSCGFISPSACGPQGSAPELALEDLGLPQLQTRCRGGAAVWVAETLGGAGGWGSRKYGVLRAVAAAAAAAAAVAAAGLFFLASGSSVPVGIVHWR